MTLVVLNDLLVAEYLMSAMMFVSGFFSGIKVLVALLSCYARDFPESTSAVFSIVVVLCEPENASSFGSCDSWDVSSTNTTILPWGLVFLSSGAPLRSGELIAAHAKSWPCFCPKVPDVV